jgi:hypothetical protein
MKGKYRHSSPPIHQKQIALGKMIGAPAAVSLKGKKVPGVSIKVHIARKDFVVAHYEKSSKMAAKPLRGLLSFRGNTKYRNHTVHVCSIYAAYIV